MKITYGLLDIGNLQPRGFTKYCSFMVGKDFALHAGKEYHVLRSPPFESQLQFMHDKGGIFIRYTEDFGVKMNKGGIKHKRIDPKVVDLFSISNIERCPICIILKYLSFCYLVPESGIILFAT